jgi:hypothetical protein
MQVDNILRGYFTVKKLNQSVFVILFPAVVFLSGCASLGADEEIQPSLIRLSYKSTNQEETGLIRGFDNGKNTILQFVDLEKSRPKITLVNGAHVTYRKVGQYAVLPGLYSKLYVKVDGKISTLTRIDQNISQ